MKKRKLKKSAIYGLSTLMLFILLGIIYYVDYSNKSLNEDVNYTYVTKLFDNGVKSVVSTPVVIKRPYTNKDVKVIKTFYDYQAEEKMQENSIINYDATYLQNNGTVYGGPEEAFDVLSILDGKVTNVKDDNLLGKVVTIKHENNITSTYQSLSEVTVKEGDQVTSGMIIGKAGTSNLEKELGNHLLLEITKDEKYINPESTYEKQPTEIK